jgi:hypothetical protein
MAGAIVTWTDSVGAATLSLWAPGVGTRVCAYVPRTDPIGQGRTLLATGARRMWVYRTDYTASVELRLLPVSALPLVNRLRAHLLNGGTIALDTGDGTHTYATLGLAPESDADLRLADPRQRRYTLSFRVLNLAASPTDVVVDY